MLLSSLGEYIAWASEMHLLNIVLLQPTQDLLTDDLKDIYGIKLLC